jgi:hypothetical protein
VTDLVVPVVIGAVAALLPFLAHWYWERRRDSTDGLVRSLVDGLREWTRRVKPAAPDPAFVTALSEPSAIPPQPITPAASSLPKHLSPVVDEAAPAQSGVPVGVGGSAEGTGVFVIHEAGSTSVATPPPGRSLQQSRKSGRGVGDPRETAKSSASGAHPARRRSTIQLDPLDAPVDGRRARITVGALIDDLERAKLKRPT